MRRAAAVVLASTAGSAAGKPDMYLWVSVVVGIGLWELVMVGIGLWTLVVYGIGL
jgi:hypothetical protein